MSQEATRVLTYLVYFVTIAMTLGVFWKWRLYLGPDNPAPRSRFLLVLCITGTLIVIAEWPIAVLATIRLGGLSLGETGGLLLAICILILASAHLLIVGYMWWLRKAREKHGGKASPPPFSEKD